jgi:hypothetical protein
MNTERIQNALREIEESLPADKSQVRFDIYGGGPDESFIRGSRVGIARLGVRLIRAALQPEQRKSINGEAQIESDLDDIVHPDSDVKFDWIEVSDNLEGKPAVRVRTERPLSTWSIIGWLAIIVIFVLLMISRLSRSR